MAYLTEEQWETVQQLLPKAVRDRVSNTAQSLARIYPLLSLLTDDAIVVQLRARLLSDVIARASDAIPALQQALNLVQRLQRSAELCDVARAIPYRLPVIQSEFPIHSREINKAIAVFNAQVTAYYVENRALDNDAVNKAYHAILEAIRLHGAACEVTSLWHLLSALSAWLTQSPSEFYREYPALLSFACDVASPVAVSAEPVSRVFATDTVYVEETLEVEQVKPAVATLEPSFDYAIDGAGRLSRENYYVLLNAFGFKPGGHVDAIAKQAADFIPWQQLQLVILRQLSHTMVLPQQANFTAFLQAVLMSLGVEFYQLIKDSEELVVSPFLTADVAVSSLSIEKVNAVIQEHCDRFSLAFPAGDEKILANYFWELLQGFQFNPGIALGIGANWDGTVSLSNESGAYAFRFPKTEASWGERFKQLSLHRQGPAEAYMNAAKGIPYEIGALASSFDYMSRLQPSEYRATIASALIDNLVAELFPEPAYFENTSYQKYRKQHVLCEDASGKQYISTFYQQVPLGTYFIGGKHSTPKQAPLYRQAGTLEVRPFPHDNDSVGSSQSYSVDNPLWALQLQYAQATQGSTRGHIVYNPLGDDLFLPDAFYGQVIRSSEGDFIPFMGVIPKNFDKHFNLDQELCASFVVRMLHSSRLREHCPLFEQYYQAIKTRFLPALDSVLPVLPDMMSAYIKTKSVALQQALRDEARSFAHCEILFFSLFKNVVYSLYSLVKEDVYFHPYFVGLIHRHDAFFPVSRATCERLLRELITNKPAATPENSTILAQYQQRIDYLQSLVQFFYPLPCEATAKAIAQQARLHTEPLFASRVVQRYFDQLPEQLRLSRKQTPGMLYARLKHSGPSKSVTQDYFTDMHGKSFPAGYRGIEGDQMAAIETSERRLDSAAKAVGVMVQVIYRTKLLAVFTYPFAISYAWGKQNYVQHHSIGRAMGAGVIGFIWGVIKGAAYTLSAPFRLVHYLLKKTPQPEKAQHLLAISSAPGNEPNVRVQTIMAVRQHCLQLIATTTQQQVEFFLKRSVNTAESDIELMPLSYSGDGSDDSELSAAQPLLHQVPSRYCLPQRQSSIEKIVDDYILPAVKTLYPALLPTAVHWQTYRQQLLQQFPLTGEGWKQLFAAVIPSEDTQLQQIVAQHSLHINHELVRAVFACLMDPKVSKHRQKIIKNYVKQHKLKPLQEKALIAMVTYALSLENVAQREQFIQYFTFHGVVSNNLKKRDKQLLQVHQWLVNALNEEWIKQALLSLSLHQSPETMIALPLLEYIKRLPERMKEPLYALLIANDEQVLQRYAVTDVEQQCLKKVLKDYLKRPEEDQKALLQACDCLSFSTEQAYSTKDREQKKWCQFVESEWRHALLNIEAIQEWANTVDLYTQAEFTDCSKALVQSYRVLTTDLNNIHHIAVFFDSAMVLRARLVSTHARVAQSVTDLLNVTMKTVVNALLDTIDVKAAIASNPLVASPEIQQWLQQVHGDKKAWQSLLTQQTEQSVSLDHALRRIDCILQAVEKTRPEMLAEQPIRGTGLQKLVRILYQHDKGTRRTGFEHTIPASQAQLLSTTMRHVLKRVEEKLPEEQRVRRFIPVTLRA